MIAVIFQVSFRDQSSRETYLSKAANLRGSLDAVDGFLGVERFQSMADENRYLSLSWWRDAQAIEAWALNPSHIEAQALGKDSLFAGWTIHRTEVIAFWSSDRSSSVQA